MKVFNEDNHGFTLIELIMVIVILGILSAIVVPRYFDFTEKAEISTEEAFIGNLKTGINLYSTDQYLTTGNKNFPCADWQLFDLVLDELPDGWSYDNNLPLGLITHTRKNGSSKFWQYGTKNGKTEFELIDQPSGSPPPPPGGGGGGGFDTSC